MYALNLLLPPIDPSNHISRFASLLEFGTSTTQVVVDATRPVARLDRDSRARTRRPLGICGADEHLTAERAGVLRVVKVADCTVRVCKCVEEFWHTGSADLSAGDVRSVWPEDEGSPLAFKLARGRECYERERGARERGCG